MAHGTYQYQSDFAKKHFSAGKAEGRAEGKAEGRAEGKAEGRAESKAESVLQVLEARGIVLSAEHRARVVGCRDRALLDVWLRKAITATSTEQIFESTRRDDAPERATAR